MLSIEVRTCQNLKPRKKRGRGEDVPKMCIFYQMRFWLVYYVLCDRSSVLKILWLWSSTLLTATTFLPAIQPDFTAVRLGHTAKTAIKKKKASTSSSQIVIVSSSSSELRIISNPWWRPRGSTSTPKLLNGLAVDYILLLKWESHGHMCVLFGARSW